MKKIVILSEQRSFIKRPLSHDAVLGQEKAFLENGREDVQVFYKSFILKAFNRIFEKAGAKPIPDPFTNKKYDDCVFLYVAMSLNYLKSNLYLLKNLQKNQNKISLYIWDCWEPEYEKWEEVLDDLKPDYLFWSFKQNYLYFKDRYKESYWVPQSANTYFFKDLKLEKSRMFIQMGRVNKPLHEKILAYLKDHGLSDTSDNYAYRRKEKEALFPDLNDLVREINRSKFIVCIPKIYENPKKTGNVCAMTGRYYEAIACKTLIIGKKPLVFDELFPKDGMIEFKEDLSDFGDKIDELENDPEKYNEIVEKNYSCFLKYHTWKQRIEQILEIVNEKQ